ncbi:MAG TPA: response regulator, partial [Candidatus Dormibacteraeota bacterium]|nr:response regulator [Candidatus Dormibacteraeota bacterium]
ISSWGFSSAEASTAEEAERLARSAARSGEPFDVALVDLRLGNGDGFDVLRCLRRDPLTSSIRAIMITAYDSASLGKTAIAAGFTGYLVKPIKQSQLFDCITGTSPSPARNARVLSASNHQNAVNGTSQFRILLAEDNAINQRLALQQLARLGYFADVVENGREAIDRSGLEHYDLILMDCQMPDIDGFEATRSIRRRESRSGDRVIIVAMTANALAEDRTACIAAGMDDYIPKPVLMGTLRATLDRWLKKAEHEASQAPSTVPSSAVLNRERLNDLFDADSAEITALLQLALHSIQRLCAQLRSTADSHDALELAHELKGTAANIGAEELSHAAESLERRLKQRDDISILTSEIETIREAEQRFADTVSGKECKV